MGGVKNFICYPAGAVIGSCITSVSAASFCQHANISDMLHPILTSFGPNNKCMNVHDMTSLGLKVT